MAEASTRPIDDGRPPIGFVRWLAIINLGLVALQPISAGLFMSGYGRGGALAVHGLVGLALQLGALVQVAAAMVQWRRHRVPAWVAGVSIGLFVMVFCQNAFGHNRQYWLHVPIGVALFGLLIRQRTRFQALWRTTGSKCQS